jgi:ribosome-binding protein aMBF1 (putative translation factor)
MKLSEYMATEGITDNELAVKVKRDRTNVLRWRKGETKPDFDALIALEHITDGKVTARDFVGAGK